MNEIVCREFEDSDWNEMVRFYEEFYKPGYVFTKRNFFDWNFSSPLRPDARSGQRVIVDGNKIIGIMGSLAWPLQVGGAQGLGQYNINLYLDPAYRGQRMGQRLLENTSSGYMYSLTSGFNERTLSMYERLGKVYHWTLRRLTKFLETEQVQTLVQDGPRFTDFSHASRQDIKERIRQSAATSSTPPQLLFERIEQFGAEWDKAWNAMREAYGFTTWRSAAFLNWRYIDYPFSLYSCFTARKGKEIVGLIVLRVESGSFGQIVRIVDLISMDHARRDMFAFAESFARTESALFIDFLFERTMESDLLEESGYCEPRERASGTQFLPMDFNPIRYRDEIPILVTFVDRDDPASMELESGGFYFVKGDGDQDRAN